MTPAEARKQALLALAERYAHQAEQLEGRKERLRSDDVVREEKAKVWREAERMARFWSDPQ